MKSKGSNIKVKQAVILCGGQGQRLRPFTSDLPKPMINCNGQPFLTYLLKQLKDQGIKKILLLTGYLASKIELFFHEGSEIGLEIEYSKGPVEWNTGKRIWESREKLDETFMLLYSDNFTPLNLIELKKSHENSKQLLTLTVSKKINGNIALDTSRQVIRYDESRVGLDLNFVEIGYMIVNKQVALNYLTSSNISFSNIIKRLVNDKKVNAYVNEDSYYSISDPERWKKTEKYLEDKKIVIVDRDGVINKRAVKGEYVKNWNDFEFIEDTLEAMTKLSREGFSFIIITNQAGIGRKFMTRSDLNVIHRNMKREMSNRGIKILKIYICPHHWEDNCDCRKPKPGMLFQASKDWALRLDKTIFVGDDPRDCTAAYKANCKSAFIGKEIDLEKLPQVEFPLFISRKFSPLIPKIKEIYSPKI